VSVGLYSGVSGLALGTGLYKNVSGLWSGASGLIAGFGGGSPFGGASLYLNFLAGAPLDPRITFTRGTNATLVDSTGKITYAPANLVLRSQEFTVSPWVRNGVGTGIAPVLTANSAIAPDGTMTATLGVFDRGAGTSSDRSVLAQTVSVTAGTYIQSMWLKAATPDDVGKQIAIRSVGGASYLIINLTATWERYTKTEVQLTSAYEIVNRQGFTADTTVSLLIWGAQLEQVTYQTTAGPYVATTTAAYYGPRFDYDPVTLAPKGLLIEEQRTNLLTYSQDFSNAAWSKSSVTVTADTTVAPDGTTTADTLTTSTTAGFTWQVVGFTGDGDKVFSCFVKAGTAATSVVQIRDATVTANRGYFIITWTAGVPSVAPLTTGTVLGVDAFGNGWYRLRLLATGVVAANSNQYRFLPDTTAGTGTVIAWGAQAENAAFATSYIPTVASQVTRNADVATMTGTNFSSWYNQSEGTFVASGDTAKPSGVAQTANLNSVNDGTSSNAVSLRFGTSAATGLVQTGGSAQTAFAGAAYTANTPVTWGMAYQLDNTALSVAGGAVTTDTSVTVGLTMTQMNIGARNGALDPINGHIRQIAYYNTRLPNATLQALTAPPLVTTLSLDFINGVYDA
jgi:hypothetical protein